MMEENRNNRAKITDASFEVQKSDVSISSLDVELHHLRTKLSNAQEREKQLQMKANQTDELVEKLQKQLEDIRAEMKSKVKKLEQVSEEKNRKLRVNEQEMNKLREKLTHLTHKQRQVSTCHSDTLKKYRQGADVVSTASPIGKGKGKASRSGGGDSVVSVDDVLLAMESDQKRLQTRNSELEEQVSSLTKKLKATLNLKSSSSPDEKNRNPSQQTEDDVNVLTEKVKDQSQRIRQLVHKLKVESATSADQKEDLRVLRQRGSEMREEIQNLRLELEARPTVAQWTSKSKEFAALESKLHDVVMMKGESKELMSWRQHLSTSDRIKADRRNHELKLWLLESLPKSVMQEVLQSICRELDVSDVSEIHPGIVKMKTVIRAVPRMEQFITTVCNFIFQRDRPLHAEGDAVSRPAMEDALPVIQEWWNRINSSKKYIHFQESVKTQLSRLDTLESGGQQSGRLESPPSDNRYVNVGGRGAPAKWAGGAGSEVSAIQKIKSLVDFQLELFRSSKSYVDAQTFISERPEVLVNSLIEHVRYLFGIKSLQGIIPRMNEVYLFSEEMCNFIHNSRQMMKMNHLPDATVLTEIYKRIKGYDETEDVAKAKESGDDDDDIMNFSNSSPSVTADYDGYLSDL